jgi:phosphatidylglycerol---prolipoprotein diacylglyceryl transferase
MGVIYVSALVGAFLGAKVVYILAEGWLRWNEPDRWLQLATGKTILGALLGGYAGVEVSKKAIGHQGATGDWFATIAPLSIMIGRVGCLMHGCCLGEVCAPSWYSMDDQRGVARWPAVPLEMLFNAVSIGVFLALRRNGLLAGQHFHLYLIGYGIFRFAHEFARETPRIALGMTGYQVAAAAVLLLGVVRYWQRRQASMQPA